MVRGLLRTFEIRHPALRAPIAGPPSRSASLAIPLPTAPGATPLLFGVAVLGQISTRTKKVATHMGLRLITSPQSSNVVPLLPATGVDELVDEQPPEPDRLYDLIVLALLLHTPVPSVHCSSCFQPWPCEQVRLAYRLREGF